MVLLAAYALAVFGFTNAAPASPTALAPATAPAHERI